MGSMTTKILDNFNRADGAVGSNWTSPVWTGDGSFTVISNTFGATSGTNISMYWNVTSFSADQEAYVTVTTPPANDTANVVAVYCRISGQGTAAPSYYAATLKKLSGTDTVTIQKSVSGTITDIGAAISVEWTAGDGLGITCVGSTIAAWRRSGGSWTLLGARTDTSITSGGFIGIESRQVARLDDFGGGNYVPIAFPIASIRDTFIRTDETTLSISSSGETWTNIPDQGSLGLGNIGIVLNQAYPVTAAGSLQLLTTVDAADCEMYITIASKGSNANDEITANVRLQQYSSVTTFDGYAVRSLVSAGTDTITLVRIDNITATTLLTVNQEFNSGDGIGIRCTGPILEIYYRAGLNGVFTRIGGTVDSTYASGGRNGLTMVGANSRATNYGGGAFISPAMSACGKSMCGVMAGVGMGTI